MAYNRDVAVNISGIAVLTSKHAQPFLCLLHARSLLCMMFLGGFRQHHFNFQYLKDAGQGGVSSFTLVVLICDRAAPASKKYSEPYVGEGERLLLVGSCDSKRCQLPRPRVQGI